MSESKRWLRLFVPSDEWERKTIGEHVLDQAPKGTFAEVRLATDCETGLLSMRALLSPREK